MPIRPHFKNIVSWRRYFTSRTISAWIVRREELFLAMEGSKESLVRHSLTRCKSKEFACKTTCFLIFVGQTLGGRLRSRTWNLDRGCGIRIYGTVMASQDDFDIIVESRSGHAGSPHRSIDPI
ncbi:hypothetical protein BQ8482_320014 [Mesorhizobium delmotii]|uniref:Uncharacterized protein n=1 Tax=Mesorhizobium delmotii TaxID=1631247 RepID=A0A2P9AP51_9HYPH|nr:hypothetical protein BQ8482_320014 [Mesorhizobium delmotii]